MHSLECTGNPQQWQRDWETYNNTEVSQERPQQQNNWKTIVLRIYNHQNQTPALWKKDNCWRVSLGAPIIEPSTELHYCGSHPRMGSLKACWEAEERIFLKEHHQARPDMLPPLAQGRGAQCGPQRLLMLPLLLGLLVTVCATQSDESQGENNTASTESPVTIQPEYHLQLLHHYSLT